MVKTLFLAVLVGVCIGVALSCAPHQKNFIKQFQMMHSGNRCVQCQEIVIHTNCTNNFHSQQFACAKPVVEYGLEPTGRCGQATIVCVSDAPRSSPQSIMVVALLDNSDGQFGQDAQVYAPISKLRTDAATVIEPCSMESQWIHESLDDLPLANPMQIQCASNAAGYVLPPMEQRYPMQRSMAETLQTAQITHIGENERVETPVSESPIVEGEVVTEDVQEVILGTTLVPVVKERVVQKVIKEIHNYPIQKKRIVKTKHLSKPTAVEREYIEQVPATKIVPTVEERRATQIIRGTTVIPMVEEVDVTEMLPELPVVLENEQPKDAVEEPQVESHEVTTSTAAVSEEPHDQH